MCLLCNLLHSASDLVQESSRLQARCVHFDTEDGAVAVKCIKDIMATGNQYDAVLCDYEMPVMDGPTAAKEMRALGCDSFIVGITGNLFPEDVRHFKSCGANLVLPKPLDMTALMDAFMEHRICAFSE